MQKANKCDHCGQAVWKQDESLLLWWWGLAFDTGRVVMTVPEAEDDTPIVIPRFGEHEIDNDEPVDELVGESPRVIVHRSCISEYFDMTFQIGAQDPRVKRGS